MKYKRAPVSSWGLFHLYQHQIVWRHKRSIYLDKLIMEHMARENVATQTSMAKYWCTDMANRVADKCIDLCGDFAISEECPITRTYRDIRVFPIFAGTNEIMKNIVARQMGLG